jgi:flagella basal body P-ring formation protein FlgA
MIRIVTIFLAVGIATAATGQIAEVSLLSPAPFTDEGWIPPPIKKAARLDRLVAELIPPATIEAAVSEPSEPARPALRRETTVSGEFVRIGDLVDNAGAVADVPIFRSPDLGQAGNVKAARVLDAVRPHHILDLDTGGIDEIMVTRASRAVTAKEMEERLLGALAHRFGLRETKDLAANFDHEVRTLYVEPGAALSIARLNYDQRTRRFEAAFELPGSGPRRPLLRVSGTLAETVEAVVPLRAIGRGEVIKAVDVRVERRAKTEAAAIEDLLGLAAKRALRPGEVIRAGDVMKPELVARNATVDITYEAPGMVLSIRGKALESGTLGDVINVLNVQSKRTIQATVTGPERVSVAAASPRVAVNAPADSQR